MSADAAGLPVPERVAVLEANRDNDVRRISKLEQAVEQIRLAGWIIVAAVLFDKIPGWFK